MGDITKGRTWVSGETATPERLNDAIDSSTINAGAVTTAKLADGVLSADVTGRAKMADGFLTTAKLADEILSADVAGRSKMADGYITSAECAANLWRDIAPTGAVLKTVVAQTLTPDSTATPIPTASTPTTSDGKEYGTVNITPSSASNSVMLNVKAQVSSSGSALVLVALFRGTTCLAVGFVVLDAGNQAASIAFDYLDSPASTSQQTYSVRFGLGNSGTAYLNQRSSGQIVGNKLASSLTAMEIKG